MFVLASFHIELTIWKQIFRQNAYPENAIDKCIKTQAGNILQTKPKFLIVKKKRFLLNFLYCEAILLNARTMQQKQNKKNKKSLTERGLEFLQNACFFQMHCTKDLTFGFVYKIQCVLCNYIYSDQIYRQLSVTS